MKAEFTWIEPDKLRNVWDTIRPGLEITARKAPGGWIPEDVYLSLKTGDAVLHVCSVDKYYRGFLISRKLDTLEGKKLLIWIAHGDASGDVFADNLDTVKEWALGMGAVKIQFQSPRRGWEKVAEKLGFTPVQVVYEIEV